MSVTLPLGIVYDGGVLPLDDFEVSTNPAYGAQGLSDHGDRWQNLFGQGGTVQRHQDAVAPRRLLSLAEGA